MIIKKGKHGNFHIPKFISPKKEIKHIISFTDSCRYNIGTDQCDINKLFGIGFLPYHRRNSIRFGWRYIPQSDNIEILSYYYIKGKRYNQHISFVDINQPYTYTIKWTQNNYQMIVNDTSITIQMNNHIFGYTLFPYFGGNIPAPHDIIINIL